MGSTRQAEVADDWPDPWPQKGWSNEDWAAWLIAELHGMVSKNVSPKTQSDFLTRALDIACMYSTRPVDRFLDVLAVKLQEAIGRLRGQSYDTSNETFISQADSIIDEIGKFNG